MERSARRLESARTDAEDAHLVQRGGTEIRYDGRGLMLLGDSDGPPIELNMILMHACRRILGLPGYLYVSVGDLFQCQSRLWGNVQSKLFDEDIVWRVQNDVCSV